MFKILAKNTIAGKGDARKAYKFLKEKLSGDAIVTYMDGYIEARDKAYPTARKAYEDVIKKFKPYAYDKVVDNNGNINMFFEFI